MKLKFNFFFIIIFFHLIVIGCNKNKNSSSTVSSKTCLSSGYFVDATNGDDSNTGTTSCLPWKTLSKVANSSFASGSIIYFKKGETWYENLTVPNSGISLKAYDSGNAPIFDGSALVTGWSAEGSNIYSYVTGITNSEKLGNLSRNGEMLTFVAWSTNASTTLSSASTNSYTYDNSNGTLYLKSTSSPTSDVFRYSRLLNGITASSKSSITIEGISLTRFSLHGIEFKNCSSCNVSDSTVTKTGGATIGSVYAGNGIEYGNSSSNGTVQNVTVSEIFDSCLSPQTYSSSQTMSNIIFKNSTLSKCGYAGVEISVLSNGGTTGSAMSTIEVNNLSISNVGQGWSGRRYGTEGQGIRIGADSAAGSITGITITKTTIDNSAGEGISIFGDVGTLNLSRLKIKNNASYGIKIAEATKTSPALRLYSSLIYGNSNYGLYFNCPNCQGFRIYQNTFYNNTTINIGILGQGNEALIKNNIFYSSSAMTHLYASSALTGADLNYNCYNDGANIIGYNGSTYSTISAFNAALGFEANGIGNGIVGLNAPASEDFSLTSSSACKSLGASGLGVTYDFAGNSYSTTPSAGALQY